MTVVSKLRPEDTDVVAERIARQLNDDATRRTFVNPTIDLSLLRDTIMHATNATWVAMDDEHVVGHLFAAVLSDLERRAAWTGPDGVSFDDDSILTSLLEKAVHAWRAQGAIEHFVWSLDEEDRLEPWRQLGYRAISLRGVIAIPRLGDDGLDAGWTLRVARASDIEQILALDHVIDVAQGDAAKFSRSHRRRNRRELLEQLDDPDVEHFVLEIDDDVVAQAITFPSPARRGSFEHTLHLSGVAVDPALQGRGIASEMLNAVLRSAHARGYEYVEAQWRVNNTRANAFWTSYGLEPTYVRLARPLAE